MSAPLVGLVLLAGCGGNSITTEDRAEADSIWEGWSESQRSEACRQVLGGERAGAVGAIAGQADQSGDGNYGKVRAEAIVDYIAEDKCG